VVFDKKRYREEVLDEIKPVSREIDPLALRKVHLEHEYKMKQLERERGKEERETREKEHEYKRTIRVLYHSPANENTDEGTNV